MSYVRERYIRIVRCRTYKKKDRTGGWRRIRVGCCFIERQRRDEIDKGENYCERLGLPRDSFKPADWRKKIGHESR